MNKELPSLYDQETFNKFLNKRQYPEKARRIFRRKFFKEFLPLQEALNDDELYAEVQESFDLPKLKITARQDSQIDGATKLLFETQDGQSIETVILRIDSGRTSLCISSQAGCTEKCTFCSTATLGFKRNLTLTEIMAQVQIAGEILREEGRQVRNIVFMGMGEPLRNSENVIPAVQVLLSKQLIALSPRRITVSTIGICDGITQLREACPEVNLAVSLHASNDRVRETLMPINKRFNMQLLRDTLIAAQDGASGNLMIQYLLIKDLNDSIEQAHELASFLKELKLIINLIPYNDSLGMGNWKASSEETMAAFQETLQSYNFQVTRRHSLGQDIDAACGQLAAKNQAKS